MMQKLDLSRIYKSYYQASTSPELVIVSQAQYISIEGAGDPSGNEFANDVSALYAVAYNLKFRYKAEDLDFVVPKLEALWSYNELDYKDVSMENAPKLVPRSDWQYLLLIRLPDFVLPDEVPRCVESAFLKKKTERIKKVHWYQMNEGKCVQMLHIGPFENEYESLQLLKTFIEKHGFFKNGLHHEIYLSDFNKTAPEKLRTILREPVR